MPTPQCRICGDFESENSTMHDSFDICLDCAYNLADGEEVDDDTLISLIENEEERRGLERQERSFRQHWGDTGSPSEESYRQDMNDAGRGHLLP